MIQMDRQYSINDIEPLLLNKSLEQLNEAERSFLEQQLGKENQILAYQQMLQMNSMFLDTNEMPVVRPKESIRLAVRAKMIKKQTPQKKGFEAIFMGLFAWMSIKSPVYRTSLALVMMMAMAWSGSYNSIVGERGVLLTDTLTRSINVPMRVLADSNNRSSAQPTQWRGLDSFSVRNNFGDLFRRQ